MYLHIFYYCSTQLILSCTADNKDKNNKKNSNMLTPFMVQVIHNQSH